MRVAVCDAVCVAACVATYVAVCVATWLGGSCRGYLAWSRVLHCMLQCVLQHVLQCVLHLGWAVVADDVRHSRVNCMSNHADTNSRKSALWSFHTVDLVES